MNGTHWLKVVVAVMLIALCAARAGAQQDLDECLAQVGLSTETARIDLSHMSNFGGGEHRLPLFDALLADPYKIPGYAQSFGYSAQQQAGSLHGLVTFAAARMGVIVRRGWLDNPHETLEKQLHDDAERPGESALLKHALKAVWEACGQKLAEDELQSQLAALAEVPQAALRRASFLLLATSDALKWREKAFAAITEDDLKSCHKRVMEGAEGYDPVAWRVIAHTDLEFLVAGAEDLALAIDKSIPDLQEAAEAEDGWPRAQVRVESPLGTIAIGTRGADTYEAGEYLLILDPGGDDHYQGGGAAMSLERPAAILIDLDGSDTYHTGSRVAFGASAFGYGFLVDAQGDDVYQNTKEISQGAGIFGVGVLLDMSGDDSYHSVDRSQAAGRVGVGVLADLAGADTYDCYTRSQGYGSTRGAGLLVDLAGNDAYIANDTDIRYPSPQTKEHNASLSQGFGYGRRADYTDGHSLAGGVGMLVDCAGDDRYACGLFGQGAGYWYGLGMLMDLDGADSYEGVWYVQAAAAHFAVGALIDSAGRDSYTATRNMAQGAGHDFSIGYLLDRSGNDTYKAPNLSLGGGNANGIGIFWDQRGDDLYEVSAATTLGRANTGKRHHLRDVMTSLGVFCDSGGGQDTYPAKYPFAGNGKKWTQAGVNTKQPLPTEKGCGMDQ